MSIDTRITVTNTIRENALQTYCSFTLHIHGKQAQGVHVQKQPGT